MATSPTPQYTDFSKDVLGRYICNGLDEALRSTSGRPDARPFDIIIVGGGSFGGAAAQHLLYNDLFHNHRILVFGSRAIPLYRACPEPAYDRIGCARADDR